MKQYDVGFVPVVTAGGELVGVVTDRDIVLRVLGTQRALDADVSYIMSENVVTCRCDDSLRSAESELIRARKSRLVVVDDGGRVAGVLSLSDIARIEAPRRAGEVLVALERSHVSTAPDVTTERMPDAKDAPHATPGFRRILVPIDFGPSSETALELAIDLADRYGAELDVVHVYEFPSYAYMPTAPPLMSAVEGAARTQFDRAMQSVATRKRGAKGLLREGVPWREILRAGEENGADLIVMGTRGRGLAHALLGSVAEKIVRMSSVPVLTVHAR